MNPAICRRAAAAVSPILLKSVGHRRATRRSCRTTACAAVFACVTFAGHSSAATFEPLPLPPGGFVHSNPTGVSGDGSVVIGSAWDANQNRETHYRWTAAGGFTEIFNHVFGDLSAISADGSTVVGRVPLVQGGSVMPVRWTAQTGLTPLPMLQGATSGGAYAISADGMTIVGTQTEVGAVRWTTGGPQALNPEPSQFFSGARAVSADGAVVVGAADPKLGNPLYGTILDGVFRWTAESGFKLLEPAAGQPVDRYNRVGDVSADGSVVVGAFGAVDRAFRWTEATGMVPLEMPPGANAASATAVSPDGATVFGTSFVPQEPTPGVPNPSPIPHAFIWDADRGARFLQDVLTADFDLDLSGWRLNQVNDVSADGRTIVGNGLNPLGMRQAWIATLDTITPPRLPGDANLDGTVNATDFDILKAHFDSSGAQWADGDFNEDGLVNFIDFQIQERHFGQTRASAAGADANVTSVPEPGAAVTLATLAVSLLARRRR